MKASKNQNDFAHQDYNNDFEEGSFGNQIKQKYLQTQAKKVKDQGKKISNRDEENYSEQFKAETQNNCYYSQKKSNAIPKAYQEKNISIYLGLNKKISKKKCDNLAIKQCKLIKKYFQKRKLKIKEEFKDKFQINQEQQPQLEPEPVKKNYRSKFDNLTRNYGTLIRKYLRNKELTIREEASDQLDVETAINKLDVETTSYDLLNQLLYDEVLKEYIKDYISNEMMDDIGVKTSKSMKDKTIKFMKEWLPKLKKAVDESQIITKWNLIQ